MLTSAKIPPVSVSGHRKSISAGRVASVGGLTGAGLAVAFQAAKANNRRDDTIVLIVAEKVEVLWLFCKWNGEMTYCLQQQHVISLLRKKKSSQE